MYSNAVGTATYFTPQCLQFTVHVTECVILYNEYQKNTGLVSF